MFSFLKSGVCILVIQSRIFAPSVVASLLSCSMALTLRALKEYDLIAWSDKEEGYGFLFSAFMTFASLVSGFRISHALFRFTESAGLLHRFMGSWISVASMFMAFGRNSHSQQDAVRNFREVLVRLISALSALCLEGLENKEADNFSAHTFEVLGFEDLHQELRRRVVAAENSAECVLQAIQHLVVDMVDSQVLPMPAPVLAGALRELSDGYRGYSEAKKISHANIPAAYTFLTRMVVLLVLFVGPIEFSDKVPAGGFWGVALTVATSFAFTFLICFINGVAHVLSNPFARETNSLLTASAQKELNDQLQQLLLMAAAPTPRLADPMDKPAGQPDKVVKRSLSTLRQAFLWEHRQVSESSTSMALSRPVTLSQSPAAAPEEVRSLHEDLHEKADFEPSERQAESVLNPAVQLPACTSAAIVFPATLDHDGQEARHQPDELADACIAVSIGSESAGAAASSEDSKAAKYLLSDAMNCSWPLHVQRCTVSASSTVHEMPARCDEVQEDAVGHGHRRAVVGGKPTPGLKPLPIDALTPTGRTKHAWHA